MFVLVYTLSILNGWNKIVKFHINWQNSKRKKSIKIINENKVKKSKWISISMVVVLSTTSKKYM